MASTVVDLPPLEPASWWPPCPGVGHGSGLLVDGPQHGIARDGVNPCLVALPLAFEPQQDIRVRMNRGRQRLPLGLLDHPSAMAGSARSTAHLAVLLIAFAFLGHILAGGNDALVF